jgi:hypothetical protein
VVGIGERKAGRLFVAAYKSIGDAGTHSQMRRKLASSRQAVDPPTTSSSNTRHVSAANLVYPVPADKSANPNAENTSTPHGGPAAPSWTASQIAV